MRPNAKVLRDRLIGYYGKAGERHLPTEALAANLQEPRLSVERAEYYTGWYSALTRARD